MKRNAVLEDANQESGDDVDGRDQNGGQRVALTEAGGAVHRAVEFGFVRNLFAAGAGLLFIDQAGIQVGVDGHLLAGHGVQGEARGNFGGAHRAVTDHHVLNRNQGQKENEANNVVAANDKLAERLDDSSRRGRTFTSVQQDAAAAGQVERESEQCQQQQQDWGRRKTVPA